MSNPTDILGKVGQKVGQEIKDIKDNYATKVSLANIGSSIDFSGLATVVSLGGVKTDLQASLASYTSGNSVFTNLKAQRAELDELVVKGDTTIVNTQTVEVSDNVIEVNLAADDDITADTGGLAVNRGLIAESSTVDSSLLNTFFPVQGTISTEGEVENVVNEFFADLKSNSALSTPLEGLFNAIQPITFIKGETATNPSIDFINGQHLWLSSSFSAYYRAVIDFGFHATASADSGKYVPEYVVAKDSVSSRKPVFKHGIEDLGNGDQDVWRRIDSMTDYEHSKLFYDSSSTQWRLEISDVGGSGSTEVNTHDSLLQLADPVPYEASDRTKIAYIDVFGNNDLTPFSESEAKTAGGQLGPDLVKYLLRSSNPNTQGGYNILGRYDNKLEGPETVVSGTTVQLPEYVSQGLTQQSINLDTQLEHQYNTRVYFTADNKLIAKAVEHSGGVDANGRSLVETVLESTAVQVGTWSHNGTNTTITAGTGFTVSAQFSQTVLGNLNLSINSTESITQFQAGTYQTPSTEVSNGTLVDWKMGAHHYLHNNSTEFPFLGSVTSYSNSWAQSGYQIVLPEHMGINYEFTVSFVYGGNIELRVKDKEAFTQQIHVIGTYSGNVATMNAGWTLTPNRPGGTNTESINLEWTGEKPAENTTSTPGVSYVPDAIAYETATYHVATDGGSDIQFTGYAYDLWTSSTSSLSIRAAGFGPTTPPRRGGDQITRTEISRTSNPGGTFDNVVTWQTAGVNGDAELLWDEPKGAWTLHKDGGAAKLYYGNIFNTASDLPSASTYHGMFAHVHDTGRGYFAHGGAWKELFDTSAGQTVTGDIEVAAGSALKVANSSGIVINNVSLGNYASFESAVNTAKA